MAVDVVGLADSGDDPVREGGGIRWRGYRNLHNGKLVATHAGDRVRLAQQTAQPVGNHPQQLVAGGMTERIVDVLEVIEIEDVGGDDLAALGPCQGLFQLLIEEHAVGQAGQRVVHRHVGDLGLGAPLLGDVMMRGDRAAVGHPLHRDRNAATVAELIEELTEIARRRTGRASNPRSPGMIFRIEDHCRADAR